MAATTCGAAQPPASRPSPAAAAVQQGRRTAVTALTPAAPWPTSWATSTTCARCWRRPPQARPAGAAWCAWVAEATPRCSSHHATTPPHQCPRLHPAVGAQQHPQLINGSPKPAHQLHRHARLHQSQRTGSQPPAQPPPTACVAPAAHQTRAPMKLSLCVLWRTFWFVRRRVPVWASQRAGHTVHLR